MQEQICNKYPNRFDVHNTHNINSYMQTLLKEIREEGNGVVPEGAGVSTKYKIPELYDKTLDRVVRENPAIIPAVGMEKILAALNLRSAKKPTDLPTDK